MVFDVPRMDPDVVIKTSEDAVEEVRTRADFEQSQKDEQKQEQLDTDLAELTQHRRINEQCFLFDGLQYFSKHNKSRLYENIIPATGDASTAVSKLTRVSDSDLFFQLKPAAMAMLVPKIRLFLVKYKDENDKKGIYQELVFEDNVSKRTVENIFKDKRGRGSGAGIKSFTYEFDGKDPATTQNQNQGQPKLVFYRL